LVKGKVYKILLTEVKKNFFNLVTDQVQPNEPEITNHKPVTDNSVILNAVETLLSSAGYDTNQLNVALRI